MARLRGGGARAGAPAAEGQQELRGALDRALLQRVPPAAWEALQRGHGADELHCCPDSACLSGAALRSLASALQRCALASAAGAEEAWRWLGHPAGSTSEEQEAALPRIRALLVVLDLTARERPELAAGAGLAYLALLSLEGAEGHGHILFQPALLQSALRALRVLQRRPLVPDEDGAPQAHADASALSADAGGAAARHARGAVEELRAEELLKRFASLPRGGRAVLCAEAATLALPELTALVARPAAEHVAREAAQAVEAIVASAARRRKVAVAALHALLPSLLMTQDTVPPSTRSVPCMLRQSRAAALELACRLVRGCPELLAPSGDQPHDTPTDSDDQSHGTPTEGQQAGGEGLDEPVLALLQRLCALAHDRSEWRAAAAESVAALLREAVAAEAAVARSAAERGAGDCGPVPGKRSLVPAPLGEAAGWAGGPRVLSGFLAFLEKLLQCERVSSRGVAVETAVALLEQREGPIVPSDPAAWTAVAARCAAAVAERCADSAPAVRCRALQAAARLLRNADGAGAPGMPAQLAARLFSAGARDEKPMVRHAALSLLDSLLPELAAGRQAGGPDGADSLAADLAPLPALAGDESSLVRRAAAASISLLLRRLPTGDTRRMWAECVLPLVADDEPSVAEQALSGVDEAIFRPLLAAGEPAARQAAPTAVAALLDALSGEACEFLRRALRCLEGRGQSGRPAALAAPLCAIASGCVRERAAGEWPEAVWVLLEEIASVHPAAVRPEPAVAAWDCLSQGARGGCLAVGPRETSAGVLVLRAMGHTAASAAAPVAARLLQELRGLLASFAAPACWAREMLRLEGLLAARRDVAGCGAAAWGAELLRRSGEVLEQLRSGAAVGPQELNGALFAVGELAPHAGRQGHVAGYCVEATARLLQGIAFGTDGQQVGPSARGHAVAAFGKLCLQREALAKSSVELLVLHLEGRQPFVVRNNIVVILGDLCQQYTSLVEQFVPRISDLLRDGSELLRRQVLTTLASLVSDGFIRFRGSIVLRFLYSLGDLAFQVRKLVECIFDRVLCPRCPDLFGHALIDMICLLNGWSGLPGSAADGNQAFSLATAPRRRAMVYSFMMGRLTLSQRFAACIRLVSKLLAPFVSEEGPLDVPMARHEAPGRVMCDCLALLGCREARACLAAAGPAAPDDEGDAAGASAGRRPVGALHGAVKQVLCEEVCPVLAELRERLAARRSPLLGDLTRCLRRLLADHPEELPELFPGDPQLAAELAFDIRAAAHERGRPAAAEGVTPLAAALAAVGSPAPGGLATPGPAARSGGPPVLPPLTPASSHPSRRRRRPGGGGEASGSPPCKRRLFAAGGAEAPREGGSEGRGGVEARPLRCPTPQRRGGGRATAAE